MSNNRRNEHGQWTGPDGQHRMSGIPEYRIWVAMIQRCHRPANKDYKYYGGRGIKVCDEWRQSFLRFIESVGARPSRLHTIERLNNDGNYEPDNVVWALRADQMRNQRSNHWLEWNGERRTLSELARAYNMMPVHLSWRLRHGWPLNAALETPIKKRTA